MKGQVRTESTGKGEKHVIATSACLSYRVIEFLGMQSTSTQHLMGPGVSLFETGCRESQLLEIRCLIYSHSGQVVNSKRKSGKSG